MGKGLLSLAKNPTFREVLYAEVNKQKWGETSALFSTLYKEARKKNLNLLAAMQPTVGTEALAKAARAFSGIRQEGERPQVLYPQLFIPFYEERRGQSATRTSGEDLGPPPVMVIYDGQEDKDTYPGYTLNDQGQVVPTGFDVNEAYAKENEVWIISLHETAAVDWVDRMEMCDDDIKNPQPCLDDDPPPPPPPPTIPTGPARICTPDGNPQGGSPWDTRQGVSVYVDRMAINCLKESSFGGKVEIWAILTTVWNGGYNPYTGVEDKSNFWFVSSQWDSQLQRALPRYIYDGDEELARIDRSDVNFSIFGVNKQVAYRWGGMLPYDQALNMPERRDEKKDVMAYCIYERDSWPVGMKDTYLSTDGVYRPDGSVAKNYIKLRYQSDNGEYCKGTMDWYQGSYNYACGETVANDCIKFNVTTRQPDL